LGFRNRTSRERRGRKLVSIGNMMIGCGSRKKSCFKDEDDDGLWQRGWLLHFIVTENKIVYIWWQSIPPPPFAV
jgi:hypothetical protein